MKAKIFWFNVGEGIAKVVRFSNNLVLRLAPWVAIWLVAHNQISLAVTFLALWALIVTGMLTIRHPMRRAPKDAGVLAGLTEDELRTVAEYGARTKSGESDSMADRAQKILEGWGEMKLNAEQEAKMKEVAKMLGDASRRLNEMCSSGKSALGNEVTVGTGRKLFRATFTLNPEVWEQETSVVLVRADNISTVTMQHIYWCWENEQKQPFGLSDDDVVVFSVEELA